MERDGAHGAGSDAADGADGAYGVDGTYGVDGSAGEPEDPLHIRPYVRLQETGAPAPSPETSSLSGDPGAGASADGAAGGEPLYEPPRVTRPDAEADGSAPLPDLSPFAAQGAEETAELPAVTGTDKRSGSRGRRRAGASAGAVHRRAGGGRRRRPGTAVLAGVGVAAVLGAGLLTTQLLTDEGRSTEGGRTLRHLPTDAPTHALPTASPSGSRAPRQPSEPSDPAPPRTSMSAPPRADRGGGEHTAPPSSSRPDTEETSPGDPGEADDGQRHSGDRRHPVRPDRSAQPTLRPGDSGPEVAELQRRLQQAGYYDGDAEEDGVYSSSVQEGVFRYQTHYHLQGDAPGDYGPVTRRHLEARTSG